MIRSNDNSRQVLRLSLSCEYLAIQNESLNVFCVKKYNNFRDFHFIFWLIIKFWIKCNLKLFWMKIVIITFPVFPSCNKSIHSHKSLKIGTWITHYIIQQWQYLNYGLPQCFEIISKSKYIKPLRISWQQTNCTHTSYL